MADANYQTFSVRAEAGTGICARQIYDSAPKGSWLNFDNCQSREEGATSSRFGLAALTTDGSSQNFPLGAAVNSLSRMQGIGTPYRYAGTTAGKLFRRAGNNVGVFSQIASGLSGGRVSMAPYRPANSSAPWQFIADQDVLLKDNGTLSTAQNWGIAPPLQPALIVPVAPNILDIELFDEATDSSFTLVNITGGSMVGRVESTMGAITGTGLQAVFPGFFQTFNIGVIVRSSGVSTFTLGVAHNFITGMRVSIVTAFIGDASFAVSSAVITVTGADTFTYVNPGPNGSTTGSLQLSCMPSFQVGMSVTTTDGGNVETVIITEVIGPVAGSTNGGAFFASFTKTHLAGTGILSRYLTGSVAANTAATVSKSGLLNISFPAAQENAEENLIQLYLLAANPLAIAQVTVMFDVGDGSFTQDYYSKAISMSPAQTTASGTTTSGSAQTKAVASRAGGGLQVSTLGGNNPSLLPSDYPLLQQLQPVAMIPGVNPWSLIQIPLSQFVANGAAGGPTNSWPNVVAWQVQIQTNPTLGTAFGLDDLVFVGGSDLNSFAGQAYDYRYTYINLNTGCESNPSQTMAAENPSSFDIYTILKNPSLPVPLAVQQQAIQVTAVASPDPQVTHWNLYRRGGSLTQAWYFVAQVPIATLTYVDTLADSIIEINNQLQVDSDAPVTSLLPTPLNATIATIDPFGFGPGLVTVTITGGLVVVGQLLTVDVGAIQETVYVSAVLGATFTAYFQFQHLVGTAVTATTSPQTSMNLAAIAFDQAWLAGDPNNPHILYYSRTYAPETFPSENFIEVGTPDAPIMAIAVLKGLLYVFTTKTIWQIFGGAGQVPLPVQTGVMHGLAASWGWAASENIIYYLSYDGVYAFTGSGSQYLTQNTEWIWTSRTETQGVIPVLQQAQKSNVFMAYGNHELFASYIDTNNEQHRQICHDQYSYRWRNDDLFQVKITAMFFEQDTGQLIVGTDGGMVAIDQVNDFDSGGWSGAGQIKNPIVMNAQTPQMDMGVPKAFKVFNEVTIDATIQTGAAINVVAVFDSQGTEIALGTLTPAGVRTQYQFNIENGLGYRSLNMGLILVGQTTSQVVINEIHVRAVIEAEERQSYDSYKLDHGSASFKVWKQGWFVYAAPDPDGIEMAVYIDDNPIPSYVFTLPQTLPSNIRTTQKVRFPALKGRIIRLVGTSASPFQMYTADTEIEAKLLDSSKGYTKMALST